MNSINEIPTIKGKYVKNLRTELFHQKSGAKILTDAPLDNNGKGEQFSPTDLLAGALASCILTVAAIRATENNFEIGKCEFNVFKKMQTEPRKIKTIQIQFIFQNEFNDLQKRIIDKAIKTCPVALSLNPDIKQEIITVYDNALKID
jgi:uncharacterized OsmC-like protein